MTEPATRSAPPQQTLRIDRIACDGAGLCAELLPDLITLDEWGYPILASGGVPDGELRHARKAVTLCPKLALHLTADTPATRPPPRHQARP